MHGTVGRKPRWRIASVLQALLERGPALVVSGGEGDPCRVVQREARAVLTVKKNSSIPFSTWWMPVVLGESLRPRSAAAAFIFKDPDARTALL